MPYDAAYREWQSRRETDLTAFWPRSEIPYGFMTHQNNGGIPNHGFTHWWTMFNPRQLLVLSNLIRRIIFADDVSHHIREFVLGAFLQYVRYQNMFVIWQIHRDCLAPHFSNNNYHPKANVVENGVFSDVGSGNWSSCIQTALDGIAWASDPWEIVSTAHLEQTCREAASQITGKGYRITCADPVPATGVLDCRSATDLCILENNSYDLVITDPPFGGLLHYAELADFFHVWLRLGLKDKYPEFFSPEFTPKALEAVANRARHPEDPDAFYQKILTECWREAKRILKSGGILAFTFHHSEDEPWVAVLESLFEAGFYLEAAYPIRSDETKGEGAKPGTFGSQLIEYDVIHVCRKRTEEPEPISWARLRRQIMRDVRQLQEILEQHQKAGLQEADLRVIRRGKALEYYSRHYGKVYIERGREGEFTVKDALVGINQLLDDESDTTNEAPPVLAEPYTRQFLRLFADRTSLPRDQMQKFLRGTGVSPNEFLERGWCSESQKVFYIMPPVELAQQWKGQPRNGMARDFDQAMFLVGACYENSGIRVQDTLNNPNFTPHPATGDVLDWLSRHGGDEDIKNAARLARQLYNSWQANNKPKVEHQLSLFGLNESEN
jgi:adenine-specific DNA methylase